MPILDLQQRARELGRIRIGQVVPTKSGKTRPEKLDRFRLTSASKPLLEKVATAYGGQVREWQPQGGGPRAWEVITDATRLPIMVPPQPVTQWYEYWTAGGCRHRCDGQTNWLTGEPCDLDGEDHLEAIKKPTTRLNVVLRDIEGVGVWRLETKGWNAAVELPNAAEFLAAAGGYVEGWVSLEERVSKGVNARTGEPETRRYMVPIIEIDVTPAELMAGRGRVQPAELDQPQRAALEAGPAQSQQQQPQWQQMINATQTIAELQELWRRIDAAGLLDQYRDAMIRRSAELEDPAPAAQPEPGDVDPGEPVDAEVVPDDGDEDPDVVWQQVVRAAGELGLTLPGLTADFEQRMALNPSQASAGELRAYLQVLQTEGVAA